MTTVIKGDKNFSKDIYKLWHIFIYTLKRNGRLRNLLALVLAFEKNFYYQETISNH